MAIPLKAELLDSDETANADEYVVRVKFSASFPGRVGEPDQFHAAEQTLTFVATTAAIFRAAIHTAGQTWKASVVAQIKTSGRIIGGISIGDVLDWEN